MVIDRFNWHGCCIEHSWVFSELRLSLKVGIRLAQSQMNANKGVIK